jgi:alcohol dehydrogenase, propanol-preferring
MKFVAPGQPLQLSESEDPPKSKIRESALVRIKAAGVCHTDIHLMSGAYDLGEGRKLPTGMNLPITLGHEISGTIERLGTSQPTRDVKEGDEVVVYPWIGCGFCRKCLAGSENLCEGKPRFLGIFEDGGYADYVSVPDSKYLVNAGGLEYSKSAPLACSGLTAFTALKKCNLGTNGGDDLLLLIIGAGGLGTTAVQIAKKTTRARVAVLDVNDERLEVASKLGADFVFNSKKAPEEKELVSRLRSANSGRGADAVIDFVGIPQTASTGFRILGREGRLVIVGLAGGSVLFPLPLFPLRGAEVLGNFTGTLKDLEELVVLAKKRLVSPIISEEFPLEDANVALEKLERGEVNGRIILRP